LSRRLESTFVARQERKPNIGVFEIAGLMAGAIAMAQKRQPRTSPGSTSPKLV
jgi:hypothetical protein